MRIYPFFIPHAGCPHRCAFCRQEAVTGQTRPPTPAEVAGALSAMLGRGAGGEVAFYGGSFTLLPRLMQEEYFAAVRPALRAGWVSGIRISTRPDALDAGQIAFLRASGVTTVEVGCQSFSPEVLRRAARGHGPEAASQSVARLHEAGLRVGVQLMPGLPGGDRIEALASLHRALRLRPAFLRIYPTVVLRGTPLARSYAVGSYVPPTLEETVELCAEMLWRCQRGGVPVIRMGLHGQPDFVGGDVLLAGPYHPAFGQLVRSRLWRRALMRLAMAGDLEVAVHDADLSDAQGHRRENLHYLRRLNSTFSLRVEPGLERHTLRSSSGSASLWSRSAYPHEELVF